MNVATNNKTNSASPDKKTGVVKKIVMVEESLKIYLTKNYEIFKRIKGNRPTTERHIQDVFNLIREHPIMIPVIVNDKMEIIDGQHRVEAYKRLEMPVPYIRGGALTLENVQVINASSKPWTPIDYAKSYVELGYPDYKTYLDFREKYDLGHDAAVWLLTGQELHRLRKTFTSGEFRVADYDDAVLRIEMLEKLKPFFSYWRDVTFVKALTVATNRENFDLDRFLRNAIEHPDMFRFFPTIDENLLMIEEIFNRGEQRKVPIRYGKAIRKIKDGVEKSARVSRSRHEHGGARRGKVD